MMGSKLIIFSEKLFVTTMHMEQRDGFLLLKECVRGLQAPHLEVHLAATLEEVTIIYS